MAETKNKNKPIPSLSGYGGVRTLQKNWDDQGNVKVKASKDIPEAALQSIKSIKIDKDGMISVEFWDKVQTLRLLAKASGLLDNPDESDKPSVIGINVKAPQVIDNED